VSHTSHADFLVHPGAGLLIWAGLVFGGLFVGGGVTLAKGRWGWALAVILTGGLLGCVTAFMRATPQSFWARRFYGPDKPESTRRVLPDRR
jgi:hypothetical protein